MKKLRRDDWTALAVLAAVVLADQLTKHWALASFQYRPKHVVWTLELVVAHNTGTAFSLLSGRGVGPAIALAAVVVVVVILRTLRTVQGRTAAIASGLVVGGAVGNLVDRLFRSRGGFLTVEGCTSSPLPHLEAGEVANICMSCQVLPDGGRLSVWHI